MRFLIILLTIMLFLSAFIGDYIVFKSKYSNSFAFRAVSDSLVHGTIGLLSASLFFSHNFNISSQACVLNILLCTALSSAIDIDHFFVAKSFYLKDLTNLNQRGVFHCTTFWILLTILLFSLSYVTKNLYIYILTFMLVIAFTSHHIRDANRRGLWLFPFGHTPPINKLLYALLLGLIPNILAYIYVYIKRDLFKNVIVEYNIVEICVLNNT